MRKRTSDYYSSDTEQITSEDIDVNDKMVDYYQDIFVMRPQMQSNVGGSFKEAKQLYDNGDDEVRQLLLKECSLIYECKKCRNMFRSLTQFIGHKRVFCRSTVYGDECDLAGGDNFNGLTSNHVMAAKEIFNNTNGKCESVLENNDNATVEQTRTLCESNDNELRDEKITGECTVSVPPLVEKNEHEKVQNILSCPQERCTLSFPNTKELEIHFSQDHTNTMVFKSPVEQSPEQQTRKTSEPTTTATTTTTTEPTVVQTRAKRMLSNSYHKCEHCEKVFERKEALTAHLMHCPVKHNILSKTLAAGISETVLAKRIKLQLSPQVSVEEPKICVDASNDNKVNEVEKSVGEIYETSVPILNHVVNIKQEYTPKESSVPSTNITIINVKKKKGKNRRSFITKIGTFIDGSPHIVDLPQIKEENGSEVCRSNAKVNSECGADSDGSDMESKKILSTCTYCNKSFERRAALSTHLLHCEVKNSVFDKSTVYGMSSCAKRSKLHSFVEKSCKETRPQSFISTSVEDPDTDLLNEMFANLGRQSFGVGLRTVTIDQDDLTTSGTDEAKEEDAEEDEQVNVHTEIGKNSSADQNMANEELTHEILTNSPIINEEEMDKKMSRRMRSAPTEKRLLCRCKICYKQFTALSNVRRHISMFHYRAQRFGCTLCEYRAFRRYDIVNHLGNSHGMTGDPEVMSIEFVSEHEVNYTREDVDGDIVVLDADKDVNVTNVSIENLENSNENGQNLKRIKRNKTSPVTDGPTVVTSKITRQKLKTSQSHLEASGNGGGKTPVRRPIRNRIKPENKDFVYDLYSLVKKDNNVAQNEVTRTLRRRNTTNNVSLEASSQCIESLLGPADNRDNIRGSAQRIAALIISSGGATSATQPELPTERPQMRPRIISAHCAEKNSVPVIEASQLEAARLQSTLLEDTFLQKVAKTSTTSFKIKPSLSLHTSTLNWLLEKVDSSLHQNANGKSSPSETLCSTDIAIKSIHVSPPPSIPRAVAPPPTPRKRITMLERLRDEKFKCRDTLLRSALEN